MLLPRNAVAALTTCLLATPVALGQFVALDDVALYAGGNLTFESFADVAGGAVVARGDIVNNGGTLTAESVYAQGSFSGPGFESISGRLHVNGSVTDLGGPGVTIGGGVTSTTGSVLLANSSQTVRGDITAAGRVEQPFSLSTIDGNILAGGAVTVNGEVTGSVTHGGTLTTGPFASIGGPVVSGGGILLLPFAAPAYGPEAQRLTQLLNITLSTFEDITVEPGQYGTLAYASSNTVTLTAGDYTFLDIVSESALNELSFDTSGGEINLYLAGLDTSFDNLVQVINGVRLFAGNAPAPQNAQDITLEFAGNATLGSSFIGTVLAPNGDVTLESLVDVTGRVLAGGNVVFEGANAINAVPEPAAAALLACGGVTLVTRRRRL